MHIVKFIRCHMLNRDINFIVAICFSKYHEKFKLFEFTVEMFMGLSFVEKNKIKIKMLVSLMEKNFSLFFLCDMYTCTQPHFIFNCINIDKIELLL